MGNCLVTKLNEIVNNSNLKRLNSLRIRFHSGTYDSTNRTIFVRINAPVNYESTYPIIIYDGDSTFVREDASGTFVPSDYYLMFPTVEGHIDFIDIQNKFGFIINSNGDSTKPYNFDIDISDFNNSGGDTALQFYGQNILQGEYKPNTNQTKFWKFESDNIQTNFKLDIGIFNGVSLTTTTDTFSNNLTFINQNGVYGDITDLDSCSNLRNLNVYGTSCVGEITTLLNSLKNGTERDLTIGVNQNYLTYNGEILTANKILELNNGGSDWKLKFHIGGGSWSQIPT